MRHMVPMVTLKSDAKVDMECSDSTCTRTRIPVEVVSNDAPGQMH